MASFLLRFAKNSDVSGFPLSRGEEGVFERISGVFQDILEDIDLFWAQIQEGMREVAEFLERLFSFVQTSDFALSISHAIAQLSAFFARFLQGGGS